MSKLTNPPQRGRKRYTLSDTIAAGSGTFLLLIAENLPDTFLFKNWAIMVIPSISVFQAKIADLIFRSFRSIAKMFSIIHAERKFTKQLKMLRNDSYAQKKDVEQLEIIFAAMKVRNAEKALNKLDRLSRE